MPQPLRPRIPAQRIEESATLLSLFQNEIEDDRRARRGVFVQQRDRADAFTIMDNPTLLVVHIGVAFKKRISGKVELSHERLATRSRDEVMHMLSRTAWVMAWHDGLHRVDRGVPQGEVRAVAVAVNIVDSLIIGMP